MTLCEGASTYNKLRLGLLTNVFKSSWILIIERKGTTMNKNGCKRALAWLMAAVMLVGALPVQSLAAGKQDTGTDKSIMDELFAADSQQAQIDPEEFVTVIVELEAATTLEVPEYAEEYRQNSVGFAENAGLSAYRENMATQQQSIQGEIAKSVPDALFRYSYTNLINGFSAYVQYKDIKNIEQIDGVSAVYVSQKYNEIEGETSEDVPLEFTELSGMDSEASVLSDEGSMTQLQLHEAWEKGYTGAGKVAAIFDSGLYSDNQLFQYYDEQDMMDRYNLKRDVDGGTIRTREGIAKVIHQNKSTMNMFVSKWTSWFHSWPEQYPDDIYESGFGDDVAEQIDAGAHFTNMKTPFDVDYSNGDFNTWAEFEGPEKSSVPSGHGTHVAGITAGNSGPDSAQEMVKGSAYDAQIFFFKVFKEQDGVGQEGDEDVFAALDDAVTLGVNSFNLSLGIAHGFSTYNTFANAGYQRAYNCARSAGIAIAVSAGNDGRDVRPGFAVDGYTTVLPNSNSIGFSSSLFSPVSVASAQGIGYTYGTVTTSTVAAITANNEEFLKIAITDNNGTVLGKEFLAPLELVYGGTKDELQLLSEKENGAKSFDGKAALVIYESMQSERYGIIKTAFDLGARAVVVASKDSVNISALSQRYLQAGPVFGIAKMADGDAIIAKLMPPAPEPPAPAPIVQSEPANTGSGVENASHDLEQGLNHDLNEQDTDAAPEANLNSAESAEELTELDALTDTDASSDETDTNKTEAVDASKAANENATDDVAKVFVAFTSSVSTAADRTFAYKDSGPVTSTSWGVTEALRLKPEIMAPGGNILSAGTVSPTSLANMSGTSMASPNFSGCQLLVQQYVDDLAGKLINIQPGTIEYSTLVDALLASTAKVYQPLNGTSATERLPLYFSPRRQGAGLAQLDKATKSRAYLHNDMPLGYNLLTGESQRTKIELGDMLGTKFDFTFVIENMDTAAHTYDVQSCLQSDKATLKNGRYVVNTATGKSVSANGADIEAIAGAVMQVSEVSGKGSLATGGTNINRYAASSDNSKIKVDAKGAAKVTISVDLTDVDMAAYDIMFTNGMFLDGFVFLEDTTSSPYAVDLNIPFMGFRGDWNAAPIFDFASAYEESSAVKTDVNYPLYHIDNLHSRITNRVTNKISDTVLGVNRFTGAAVPQFDGNKARQMREYMDKLRLDGNTNAQWISFSPNNDGQADTVYAQMGFLRNAKMVGVVILDDKGKIVRNLGTEYEYFAMRGDDGNKSHLVQTTGYDRFNHQLVWDGNDDSGKKAPDGQYSFKVSALLEHDYLKLLNADETRDACNKYISSIDRTKPLVNENFELKGIYDKTMALVEKQAKELLANSKHTLEIPVKIDTKAPMLSKTLVGTTLTVDAKDNVGVQGIAVYYDGVQVGTTSKTNGETCQIVVDLEAEQTDISKITAQAIDYAMNIASSGALQSVSVSPATSNVAVGAAVLLTADVAAGAEIELSYKWQQSKTPADADSWINIEKAMAKTYAPSTKQAGEIYYRCIATSGDVSKISNTAFVSVTGSMSPAPSDRPDSGSPTTPTKPILPIDPTDVFTDITSHWGKKAIGFVVEMGLFKGVTDKTFAPDAETTRGMIATVLARMAGADGEMGTSRFADVASNTWYAQGVEWCVSAGIVSGVGNNMFAPEESLTREQLCVMLANYAKHMGVKLSNTNASHATDSASISAWAFDAVMAMYNAGVVKGKPVNMIDPQGLATRAEVATMLERFIEIIKQQS